MKQAELIVAAEQVVTCAGPAGPRTKEHANEIGVIERGAVALAEGKILEVGPSEEIYSKYLGDRLELPGTSIIPGLVDAHCHPIWAGSRNHEFTMRAQGATYEEIHAAGGGIAYTVEQTRQANDDTLYKTTHKVVERMLAHGTTTLEAKSGYGLSTEEELRHLTILKRVGDSLPIEMVPTCLGAHSLPPEYAEDRQGFLRTVTEELLPACVEQGLAEFADVFCERGAFTCEESRQVLEAAKELGLGLRIHAEEFSNLGGSRMAAQLGANSCDHLQQLALEDYPFLKESGTIPVVIPGTSFFLDMNVYADARRMWDEGLPVALGTDFNAGSCQMESMQMAMSLAVLKMKMTPAEALTAATVNAAHSLNRGDRLGSLEPGKQADLLLLNTSKWQDSIYRFGGNAVRAVVKNGVVLNTILRTPLGPPL